MIKNTHYIIKKITMQKVIIMYFMHKLAVKDQMKFIMNVTQYKLNEIYHEINIIQNIMEDKPVL